MADQKMKINRLADKVRGIPLRDVLERYGFDASRCFCRKSGSVYRDEPRYRG
jgi:hypothetical protein